MIHNYTNNIYRLYSTLMNRTMTNKFDITQSCSQIESTTMTTHTIFGIIKPTIIGHQIMGYFPFIVHQSNEKIMFKYSAYRKYLIAPTEMFCIILINILILKFNAVPHFTSVLHGVVHLVFGASTFLATILISIKLFASTKLLKQMYWKIIQLDEDFRKFNMCRSYQEVISKNNFYLVSDLVIVLISAPLSVVSVWNVTIISFLSILTTYYLMLHSTLVTCSFINFVNVTSYFFAEINSNFNKKILMSNKLVGKKLIIETGRFHQKVCEFSSMINEIFSFSLLVIFTVHFLVFTTNSIYIVVCIIHREVELFTLVDLFWVVYCGFKTYIWIELSSDCMKSVSNISNLENVSFSSHSRTKLSNLLYNSILGL